MVETIKCSVKSHEASERRFQWDQLATGDWEARAYCIKHDEPLFISAIDPVEFGAVLPPKPPVTRTLL